jgi:pteridine reductase
MNLSTQNMPVVLITGGAKRIGKTTASLLHKNGFNLVIHYNHSHQEAQDFVQELNEIRPDSANVIQGDLRDVSCVTQIINFIQSTWARLDGIVYNASLFEDSNLKENTVEELSNQWDKLLNCHGKIPFLLAHQSFKTFPETFNFMVNICDIYGTIPLKNYSIYSISKSSLIMVTKTLAKELSTKIRINGIAPGLILLPDGQSMDHQTAERMEQKTCLSRIGQPIDIAKTVLFLAKDGDYITGQIITVDGGRTLFC